MVLFARAKSKRTRYSTSKIIQAMTEQSKVCGNKKRKEGLIRTRQRKRKPEK